MFTAYEGTKEATAKLALGCSILVPQEAQTRTVKSRRRCTNHTESSLSNVII